MVVALARINPKLIDLEALYTRYPAVRITDDGATQEEGQVRTIRSSSEHGLLTAILKYRSIF